MPDQSDPTPGSAAPHRVIEIDRMTGAERDITWCQQGNSLEECERAVQVRRETIVSRYDYRIEAVDGT